MGDFFISRMSLKYLNQFDEVLLGEVAFLFQNNPKNLDLSYKTDLDFWDCCGRKKTCFIAKDIR